MLGICVIICVMDTFLPFSVREHLAKALDEDLSQGDVTTDALVRWLRHHDPKRHQTKAKAVLKTRQPCVVSGLDAIHAVFTLVDADLEVTLETNTSNQTPGDLLPTETVLATVYGAYASILRAERTALNLLQHLCGIATITNQWVKAVEGTGAKITDTRKTLPGLRWLEKRAVLDGGGYPHRYHLGSAVMLKDNHLSMLGLNPHSLTEAITSIKATLSHTMTLEVEVDHLSQIALVLAAGVDTILLDNMSPTQVQQAALLIGHAAKIEVSGGLTLATVKDYAQAGAQYLSTSAITLGAAPVDIGLDFIMTDG
jgi:nicotinate-nucleotide pyrophosphorylase (carboxylating)